MPQHSPENTWTGMGVLLSNPLTRPTVNGSTVTDFRLAVARQGGRPPMHVHVKAFNSAARRAELRLGRGAGVRITGRLETETRTAPDGSRRREFYVVASDIEETTR